MRVGILELDGTYRWQPDLRKRADFRLRLDPANLHYLAARGALEQLAARLRRLPAGLVFLGSGDFHHLALALVEKHALKRELTLVVVDGHADLFPAADGFVSCGSWVGDAARLPGVRGVVLLGCSEGPPPHPGVTAVTAAAWRRLGARTLRHLEALIPPGPVYVSVDKDALRGCPTSWGEGEVDPELLFAILRWVLSRRQLVGADVCGEPRPRRPWPTDEELAASRSAQLVNLALCGLLEAYPPAPRASRTTARARMSVGSTTGSGESAGSSTSGISVHPAITA